MTTPLRCESCEIDLDADAERCPRCLRKSTVSGGEPSSVPPSPAMAHLPTARPRPAGDSKGSRIGAALIALVCFGLLIALRTMRAPPARPTIFLPANPSALLDPLGLASIRVDKQWVRDADGLETLHLTADAGDFDRTLKKLSLEVLIGIDDTLRHPKASGVIRLWLPERFDDAPNRAAAHEEERLLDAALDSKRAAATHAIKVSIAFGGPPARAHRF